MDTIENVALHQILTFTFCVYMTGFSCLQNPDLNFLHGYDWGFSCLLYPPEAVFENNGIHFMGIKQRFLDSA